MQPSGIGQSPCDARAEGDAAGADAVAVLYSGSDGPVVNSGQGEMQRLQQPVVR